MSQSSATDAARLTELVNVISDAVKVVISEYSAAGESVPSLDSTAPGPFDSPEKVPPGLSKAVKIIQGACAQLSYSVASPGYTIVNKAFGYEEPACMRVVSEAKIADLLLNKPDGVHIDELAKQSGLDAGKLGRIMRLLVTTHCFTEVKPNVFANNRLSIKLLSTDFVSSAVCLLTDELQKSASYLNETLADPKSGPSLLPQDASFSRAHGSAIFDFYGADKMRRDRFNRGMVGWGEVAGKAMLPKAYPWADLPEDTVICDIGGGNGHATLALMQTFPHLKVTLQDLPDVIEQGREYWGKEYPEALGKQRIQFVPFDFFNDAAVEGCDFYFIRQILHDWPHAECLKILANVRKSMKPSSKLLINEAVFQPLVRGQTTDIDQAPEPLLPNYGMGNVKLYLMDINMMSSLNSKERTLEEFVEMCKQAGFKFVKLYESGETSLVEFSPA